MSIDPDRERISMSMRRVPLSEQMEWIMNLEDAAEAVLLDGNEELLEEESEKDKTTSVDSPDEIDDEVVEVESDEDPTEAGEERVISEEEEITSEEAGDSE